MPERRDDFATVYGSNRACPIGPYQAHTVNAERDECIWCGPNRLAWRPGHWVSNPADDTQAWSATEPYEYNTDKEPLIR